jgi:hypothetical protein
VTTASQQLGLTSPLFCDGDVIVSAENACRRKEQLILWGDQIRKTTSLENTDRPQNGKHNAALLALYFLAHELAIPTNITGDGKHRFV